MSQSHGTDFFKIDVDCVNIPEYCFINQSLVAPRWIDVPEKWKKKKKKMKKKEKKEEKKRKKNEKKKRDR